ncbi:hypothetical protein GPJ56_004289 [Histomonas meleagridis]|nr:hypothetical protein GPJ56_004289 [Histomonas meleagridis]
MHLPTWKRSFQPCWSPKSEIKCSQLTKAYDTIINWEKKIQGIDYEDHRIVDLLMKAGIGNGMYHAASGVLMGVLLNRAVFSHYNFTKDGLLFPPSVPIKEPPKDYQRTFKQLLTTEYWPNLNYSVLLNFHLPFKAKFLYPYQLLTDPDINYYTRAYFGVHFIYFLSNYFTYFSDSVIQFAQKQFKSIPQNIKVIGVHVRRHYKGKFFIWNLDFLKRTLQPFLDDLHQNSKQYIFFTSNYDQYTTYFKERYQKRFFISEASKKEDGNKRDALNDMACLIMCDKLIGTFRSSFTTISAMRAMTNAYYMSCEVDSLFRFSSTQMGLFSMIVDESENWNYMANYRLRDEESYESGVRAFFYYFGI